MIATKNTIGIDTGMKFESFSVLILAFSLAVFVFSACSGVSEAAPLPPDQTTQNEPNKTQDGETDAIINKIFLTINGRKIAVKLEENAATAALIELLKQDDIIYTASDYGGFEKVGNLGHALPRTDTQMTAEAGDIMLYLGNQIVLFYGSNSWSYTKLGEIQGISEEEWKAVLTGSDSIRVEIGLQ